MPQARATFTGEEVEVKFTATATADWIGDASVPNGTMDVTDISDYEVDSLTILGVEVDFTKLPDDLQAAILALADDLDFEVDEPDDDYEPPDYDD